MDDTLRFTTTPDPAPEDGAEPPPEPERVDLFEIDGIVYRMMANPDVPTVLRLLGAYYEAGPIAGRIATIQELCGDDAYTALTSYKELTADEFASVAQKALNHAIEAAGLSGN